ncbi:uncharacterized protein Dana_GF21686, isoform K [Drosophila ananassae]|uniref:Uncharacterized protein, isoform K n=1 Tax=Drosophila ananassae TaxID=7217 RepID=A0A0N8NZL8_DROAN|nr:uncharacterized protein LOC6504358 isoform X19 [Drosophila ananassae]KPU74684.1 uncharacterized protein Dana_GF21686, isoform K [Drosophila ananassae]
MDSTSEVLEACIHSPNSTLDNDANITKDITSDEYNTLKNDTELKTTDELIIKPLENILTVDTDTIQLSEEPQINNIKETSSTRIENNNSKIDSSLGSDNENNSSSGNTTSLLGKASDEEKKLVEVTKVDEHEMPTETESDEDGTECLKENTTDDEKCIPESYKSEHVQINSPKEEDPIEKSKAEAKLFSENLKIDVKSEIDLPKNEDPIEKSKAEAKLFSENLKIDVKSEIDLPKNEDPIEESMAEAKLISENEKIAVLSEINSTKNEDPLEKSMAQAKLIFENEQIAVKSEINSPKNEDPMEKSMAQAKLIFENEKIAVKSEINSPKNEDPMDESKAEAKEIFENEKIAVKSEIHSPKNENDYNKQIKHIISDIDVSIRAQMEIAKLKAEEQKLIDKQNELTQYIQQQQQLAQELSLQNQVKIKKLQQMPVLEAEKQPKLLECNSNTLYKDQINPSKTVDLRKIFTPATDTKEILPKNHYQQHQLRPATSPNILPAYSDAAKHRVLLNIHQNQVIKKYSKPGLKFVTSPWEAALQTGSASSAFLEPCKNETTTTPYYSENGAKDLTDNIQRTQHDNLVFNQETEKKSEIASSLSSHSINVPSNTQRNLAYIPNVAQGWGGRNVKLPKGLFIPKEISLSSYAPPPEIYQNQHKFEPVPILNIYSFEDPNTHNTRSAFPLNETNGSTNSYQKGPKEVKITSQVTFSPSQLSSDKIARFEHVDKSSQKNSIQQYLTARPKTNVRNASPTPFGVAFNKSATRSPNSISSFGTTLSHPSTTPSTRSGQFYNSKASSLLHQGPTSKAHAHGWDAKNSQEDYWCSPQQHENLPYTDF